MTVQAYVRRQYATFVGLTWLAQVTCVSAVALVENIGILANHAQGMRTAMLLMGFAALDFAHHALPMAGFFAALAVGANLSQRGEWLAMQALGLRRRQTWAPLVQVSLGLAAVTALWTETVLPIAAREHARLQREQVHRPDPLAAAYAQRSPWLRRGHYVAYLPDCNAAAASCAHPELFTVDAGRLTGHLRAQRLQHVAGGMWRLDDVVRQNLVDGTHDVAAALPLDLDGLSAFDLFGATGPPRERHSAALLALIRHRDRAGYDTTAHRLELYGRLAQPAACLGLLAWALPWATCPSRRRTAAQGVAAGVGALAIYLAVGQIWRLLALAHKLPPALGAAGPMLVLAAGARLSATLYRRYGA